MPPTSAKSSASEHPLAATLRAEVRSFKPYVAGRSIEEIKAAHGLSTVVKLASNENPLGTSPLVQKTLKDHAGFAFRYPRTGNPRLREAIAAYTGAAPEMLCVGNGSDELIDLLIRVRCRPQAKDGSGDVVLAFKPSFSMYRLQAKLCGCRFEQVELNPDFSQPLDKLAERARELRPALVFLTTPDNPSGYAPPLAELRAFVRSLPETTLLVLDEAYMDFAVPPCGPGLGEYSLLPELVADPETYANVVVLRTFSKLHGLAGLRLGYSVSHPWLADYLWRVRPPFSVNLLAEEAGIAALGDETFRLATLETVAEGRAQLTAGLEALCCTVKPSLANFLLFHLPQGARQTGTEIFELLLTKGVIVRPLASYGLPEALRVSIGTRRENETFLKAMAMLLKEDGRGA